MSDFDALMSIMPHDEALEARITALLNRFLSEAEYIMDYGSTTQKIALISKGLPAMLKSFGQEESAQMLQVRQYLEALNAVEVQSVGG